MNHWKTPEYEYQSKRSVSKKRNYSTQALRDRERDDYSVEVEAGASQKEASAFLGLLAECIGSLTSVFQKPAKAKAKVKQGSHRKSSSQRRRGSAIRKSATFQSQNRIAALENFDEEDDALASAEMRANLAARALAQRNSGTYDAYSDQPKYDPRTSSLHESVVHAMAVRPELTEVEDEPVYQFDPEKQEKEYLDDLSFLSNSSSRKPHNHAASHSVGLAREYVPTCTDSAYAMHITMPAPPIDGNAAPPLEIKRPQPQQRSFNSGTFSEEDDCWGDFDVPKDAKYVEPVPEEVLNPMLPEGVQPGVCECEECLSAAVSADASVAGQDFGVGLPPAAY